MFSAVDTKDPAKVEEQVASIYADIFPNGDRTFVRRAFNWAGQCFSGQFGDYQAIDARYHDFEHTLQGALCLARLLHGRHRAGATPALSRKVIEHGLLAILFHDTGYLKKKDDTEGTGAKYTLVHVDRSAAFAGEFLFRNGRSDVDPVPIQHMIKCTGVQVDLQAIPFSNVEERLVGYALGTADLLGQMAAADYVEKLPILFSEYAEAALFEGGDAPRAIRFKSAEDLMRKTPGFWERYALPKFNNEFEGLHTFLNDPYPDGPNDYIRRIESNIARLRGMLEAEFSGPDLP
jgi:hypothetical protein